jgi:hypothetical protein
MSDLDRARAPAASPRWREPLLALLLAIVGVPLAALLAVQVGIPGPAAGPAAAVATQLRSLASPTRWPALVAAAFSGLGILPLVLLHAPGDSWRILRAHPHWLLWLVLALGLLLGGSDKSRLFLYALPSWPRPSAARRQRCDPGAARRPARRAALAGAGDLA